MKYIRKFNENVIMPNIITNDDDTEVRSFRGAVRFGIENGFDVVNYDEFYQSLGDADKKTAPPSGDIPFFALYNKERNKAMFVIDDEEAPRHIPNFKEIMIEIIGHENVHIEQNNKRTIRFSEPNPLNKKEYFTNKDEIMAFSWTIANGLHNDYKNIEDAMHNLNKRKQTQYSHLWQTVKNNVDMNILKKYHKYIYMYLDKMYNE